MVPQGPPTPLGGAQPVPSSLLRSNSGLLGRQGTGMLSQNAFPSLVSPRNNLNMLDDNHVSSLLLQSFGNGGQGSSQCGLVDGRSDSSQHSGHGNGVGFTIPSSSYISPTMTANQNPSGQVQGQQHQFPNASKMLMADHQPQTQLQLDSQNSQHNNNSNQQRFHPPGSSQQQQQQFQGMRPSLGPIKLEQQSTANDQSPQQQLQALRSMGSMKMEPQQLMSMRGLGPVKSLLGFLLVRRI